ncbi:MAG TPA: pyridoxamine 5'-phosphate oxidase family protein [Syntrophorhabdaceae bacterium]|nr:pyridoxamine 5'-phosphate oxidase family protein [Syntrophorhabdaceae bacterium]
MDIQQHWGAIRNVVNKALESNHFCAVATVNPDGSPRVSPIGSLILYETGKAFYFEEFPKNMRLNLDRDQRICVMAVNGGFWHWLKALFKGRFDAPPGVRLTGRAGARRMATQEEVKQWQERVKRFRRFKGYKLLWKDMRYVREVIFDGFEPVHLGLMGEGLWEERKE